MLVRTHCAMLAEKTKQLTHLSRSLFAQHRRHGFQSIRGGYSCRHVVSAEHVDRLPGLLFFRYLHRHNRMFVGVVVIWTRWRWRRRCIFVDNNIWPSIDGIDVHRLLTHSMCVCVCAVKNYVCACVCVFVCQQSTLVPNRNFQSRIR